MFTALKTIIKQNACVFTTQIKKQIIVSSLVTVSFFDYTLLLLRRESARLTFLFISLSFSLVFLSLFVFQNDTLFHLTFFSF